MSDRMKKAYTVVRENLKRAAERNQRYYDMRVKPRSYQAGDWVYYFNPRRFKGKQEKWTRKYTGPYLVEKVVGEVNVIIRKNRNTKPMCVHIDKLKPYTADDTPASWLKEVPAASVVKEEVSEGKEVNRDVGSEEKWNNEDVNEVKEGELNYPVDLEDDRDDIPAETPTGSVEVEREEKVLDERPIAGIPPAQYKTRRPKREQRLPARYR